MFEIDNSKSGEDRGLQNADKLEGEILLPFCPESDLSGVGVKDFMYCVWYKKVISFTEEELSGNRILFHIGAADFETKVWVNGKLIGLPHIGCGSPIEYDITSELVKGENIVTVACYDDTRSPRQPGGKQCREHRSRGCFYTRTTGIWQTVWYEVVPESYIKYAKLLPDLVNGTVTVLTELRGTGDLSAEVYYNGKKVGEAKKKDLSVTGQMEISLSEIHPWELGCGGLYDMILNFGNDRVKTYFGLRSVELKDGKFLLNGKCVFQRMVLDQGFYPDGIWTAPSEEALIKDIQCSMSVGFNGARLHQKVFEPRFLYHCDRLGYMVWGEYNSCGIDYSDITSLSYFLPDWMAVVRRDFNHPAIIGWCPLNETWKGEPVFVSEYGGIGINLDDDNCGRTKPWCCGKSTKSFEEYYARYKGLTDALLNNPRILGFCYTQLTDVEQEQNGLFTYDGREPKFDVKILYAINSRKAAIED